LKKMLFKSLAFALSLALVPGISVISSYALEEEEECLVVFDDSISDSDTRNNMLRQLDVNILEEVPLLNTAFVTVTSSQREALKQTVGIKSLVKNNHIPCKRKRCNPNPPGCPIGTPEPIPWNVQKINANQVWDANGDGKVDFNAPSTGENVRLALWDSGAFTDHPDIKRNIHKVYNATVVGNKKDVSDHYGHGTGMAGVMAASQNNEGIVGVAPKAKLSIVKIAESSSYDHDFSEDYGRVTPMAIARAFEWSIKNKMQVIEMTIGWFDQELVEYFGSQEEVDNFINVFQKGLNACYEHGIVCVAPALNTYYDITGVPTDPGGPEGDGRDGLRVPQNLNHIILASATTANDTLTDYSCYANENVENKNYVCAPGENITVTVPPELVELIYGIPDTYYLPMERGGTSSANAETAAVCALIVGAGIRGRGHEIVDNVWKVLSTTATKIGDGYDEQGRSHQYGYGLINAKAAVDKVLSGQY